MNCIACVHPFEEPPIVLDCLHQVSVACARDLVKRRTDGADGIVVTCPCGRVTTAVSFDALPKNPTAVSIWPEGGERGGGGGGGGGGEAAETTAVRVLCECGEAVVSVWCFQCAQTFCDACCDLRALYTFHTHTVH